MNTITIVYPENLTYAVGLIKDHIDKALADANGEGNTGNDKDDVLDSETINQMLVQTGFPAIT